MKRTYFFLLAAVIAIPAARAAAQDSVVLTRTEYVDSTDRPSARFARVYAQTEQWRVVHSRDIANAIRLLSANGSQMGDYLASLVNNSAQGHRDWVFWSIACGALAETGGNGTAVLHDLANNFSADPWARLAARDAINGRFRQ